MGVTMVLMYSSLMLVTRARVPWFQIWTYYVFMNICEFLILSCKSLVTYYVLWSGNPEVTIIGTTPGDDHSLRSSCIHYVLMLCSSSLLKGGLNIPEFPYGPRFHGWVGQKMPGKFFSITTYDYLRNTCLHYIYELELVLYRPRLWLLYDEYHPMNLPIQCLRTFYILFLLSSYCCCYCYTC